MDHPTANDKQQPQQQQRRLGVTQAPPGGGGMQTLTLPGGQDKRRPSFSIPNTSRDRRDRRMTLAAPISTTSVIMANAEEHEENRGPVKEFLISHVKTIVTVFMIFGTIAVIVCIVYVHKLKFESQQAAHELACLDVAIIGAGLSGSYAAWRLRNHGIKVHVYEMTNRVGGRFYTKRFDDMPGVNGELGAMFYVPQLHPLMNQTIHALRLEATELRPLNRDHVMYYLRGVHLRHQDLSTNKVPYNLLRDERNKYPSELRRKFLEAAMSNKSDILKHPLSAITTEGTHLYKNGYWNLLARGGSKEAYNYLYDTEPYRSFLSNENAAVLGVPHPSHAHSGHPSHSYMTVKEGMDAIPKEMLRDFLISSTNITLERGFLPRHDLHLNRRLDCIHREGDNYKLTFIITTPKGQMVRDTFNTEEVCTRNVIVAAPKKAFKKLTWLPLQTSNHIHENLEKVKEVNAMRVLFVYNKTWWNYYWPGVQHIITDLPLRQIMVLGGNKAPVYAYSSRRRDTVDRDEKPERHTMVVASPDGTDTEYFSDLTDAFKKGENVSLKSKIISDITAMLGKAFEVEPWRVPPPQEVIVQDWGSTSSGGGWHLWKKGVHWGKVRRHVIKPHRRERVYIIGSSYCGGQCQLWAEGALQSVDELLKHYLDVR